MSVSPRAPRSASDLDRVDVALDVLNGALMRQIEHFRAGHIAGEEDLTSALVTAARFALDGIVTFGVKWEATVLTRRTEEPRHGADLLFILDLDLPSYTITKGFLAQAKLIPPERSNPQGRERLVKQCNTMLNWTPAAYVWTYSSRDGVRVYPAMSVAAVDGRIHDLNYMPLPEFFTEHFACFLGDRALAFSETDAQAMLGEYRIGRAVIVRARQPSPDDIE